MNLVDGCALYMKVENYKFLIIVLCLCCPVSFKPRLSTTKCTKCVVNECYRSSNVKNVGFALLFVSCFVIPCPRMFQKV